MTLRRSLVYVMGIVGAGIVAACSAGTTGFNAQPCGGDAGTCPTSLVCSAGYCSAPEGDAGTRTGAGDGGGVGASEGDSGAVPKDGGSCVSDVPCASESQCVAVGGSTCNQVLHRCQTVFCQADGQPCSNSGQCQGEICEPSAGQSNNGVCTNRQARIDACAVECAKKLRAATFCGGHPLGNADAACKEICAPFLDDKSCSKRVIHDGICLDDGRCQIMDGCGKSFKSTSSCD